MRLVLDGIIFQKDPHGGVARMFREILPRMCELDPELQVTLFLDGPVQAALPAHARITVQRAPAVRRTLRVRGAAGRLLYPLRRLAGRAWDRLRAHWLGSGAGAIWHSTYYTLPPRWDGPQVVTVYDMAHEQMAEFFTDPVDELGRRMKQRCVEQAQAVICISESTRRAVARQYAVPAGRLHLVYNACSPVFRRLADPPALDGELQEPFILYVGSRAFYKNFGGLLDAYRQWPQRERVRLVAAGQPWTEGERHRLAELGLDRRVLLRTQVSDEQLCRLYNAAQAFVFPSMNEGFGIPLLEALACGCPVVAARLPVFMEVAGEAARYFWPDRPDELLAALDAALAEGRSAAQVAAGLQRAQAFSWERTAEQTLAVYRSVYG
ncbi:MAG: glycosyltransferase family 4 protein [Chloroflexota bacterium]